jgi:flagellar assembly protein FliH
MSSSEAAREQALPQAAVGYAFEQLDTRLRLAGGGAREADRLRREAWAQGEAEGRAAGFAQARELAAPAVAALATALAEVDALREQLIEQLERDAVEMALALTEHILGAAIEVQPASVLDSVRGALRRMNDRQQVTALVSPEDLELVSASIDAMRGELGGIEHLAVQADRRISRGGAIVRTLEGEIDAQITTQLARARAIVAAELTRE